MHPAHVTAIQAQADMIRSATIADCLAVTQLVQAAYTPYIPRIGKPPGPMLDDYAARIALGQAWVLERSGTIIGVLVLEDVRGALLVDNVAIAPHAQGSGFGRALMAFAEEEARRRHHREMRLYTNALMTENIALYERLGFVQTQKMHEKGFDRVYMAKLLD